MESMYGPSTLTSTEGITTIQCIYGDPELIIYSPEWVSPNAIDSTITESNNQQPLAPTITGPSIGKPGTEYTINFVTTDPNGDNIYYYVDWGDGTTKDWDGPFTSGQQSSASHTWSGRGVYIVRVKAKDVNGAEGPWGVLHINVPKAKTLNVGAIEKILARFPLLGQILIKILAFR